MKIYFTRVLFIATHARVVAAVVTGTTLCGLASARAQAPSFTFTSLVDTSTSVPGQPGTTFNGFGAPSIQGGNVIFSGSNGSYTAIYTTPANAPALSTVVDANTTVPGHDGVTFSNVFVPTLSGSNIAFAGNSTAGSGYYTTTGSMSAITMLAERGEAASLPSSRSLRRPELCRRLRTKQVRTRCSAPPEGRGVLDALAIYPLKPMNGRRSLP